MHHEQRLSRLSLKIMAEKSSRKCPKGHDCPEISHITRTFALKDKEVLSIYIVGSHMWGSCHKTSDWDLVIVIEKLSSPKPLNLHKSNLEAFILSKEQYSDLIKAHSMQVLLTLWLPPECVLRENFNPRSVFQFSKDSLIFSLEHSKDRDLRISEKHFRKSDAVQAKKVLLHCIRYLDLALQIKNGHKISDYTSANQHREEVYDNYDSEWTGLMKSVQPIIDRLWTEIQM